MDNLARNEHVVQPLDETGKKRSSVHGVYYDKPTVINQLPAIGSYIILCECIVRIHPRISEKVSYQPRTLDARGNPVVLKVKEYTQGMELPYSPNNFLVAEYQVGERKMSTSIPARLIACGHFRVEIQEGVEF